MLNESQRAIERYKACLRSGTPIQKDVGGQWRMKRRSLDTRKGRKYTEEWHEIMERIEDRGDEPGKEI
jgi:hypothetical protein